jgi:hypothetical protein
LPAREGIESSLERPFAPWQLAHPNALYIASPSLLAIELKEKVAKIKVINIYKIFFI